MTFFDTRFGKRALMVGLIAGSGALAASAFAMPQGGPARDGCSAQQSQSAVAPGNAKHANRLTQLKEKLNLQPAQEAAWQAFTSTTKPARPNLDKAGRQAKREAFKQMNTPQRLDAMLAMAEKRQAHLARRAQAVKQLYAQLSPAQQAVFDAESRSFRHGGKHHHGQRHRAA